ncbi:Hypothetical predicted protein, partial [Marmota monax]
IPETIDAAYLFYALVNRNSMDGKVMDTTVSSLQDLRDPKPPALPRHHATLLERQQEASWEE